MFNLKDIVVWVKMALNPASAAQTIQQVKTALNTAFSTASSATGQVSTLNSAILGTARSARQLGLAFMTYLGGRQIINFLRSSVDEFIKFDRGLQRSVAIMEDATDSIRKQMSDTALQISRELNLSASDVSEAYYFLASAGLSAEASLKAMPAVALFAKAGLVDLSTATELLAQSQSALGMRSADANENLAQMVRLMDVLAKADNESQASLTEFAAALTNKAGASLRMFRKPVEEGAAALAVLADQGTKGRLAGERLDIFLRQVTQSALNNAEAFKAYGIEVFDNTGKMRNFADIADDLTKALGHLSDEQQVQALEQLGFQVRTVAVIKQFIGMGDAIRRYEDLFSKAGGTTRKMADTQLKAAGERLGLLIQKFNEAKIEIGESLIPTLEEFATLAGDEGNPLSVISAVKRLAEWIGGGGGTMMSKSLGAALNILGVSLIWIIELFSILGSSLVVAVNAPMIVFGTIATTVSAVLGGTVAMIGAFLDIIGFDRMGQGLQKAGNWMLDFARKMALFTSGRVANTVQNIGSVGDSMQNMLDAAMGRGGRKLSGRRTGVTQNLDGAPKSSPTPGTGSAEDEVGDAADRRLEAERNLLERLEGMRAKYAVSEQESERARLAALTADLKKFYGGKIPATVMEGLEQIAIAIEDAEVHSIMEQMFNDLYDSAEPDEKVYAQLQKFIDKLNDLRDATEEGSEAYREYSDLILQASNRLREMGETIDDAKKKKQEDEIEDRLERIRRIGERTADRLADSFGDFFNVLLVGSKRGADAFETLGRGLLASMISPLGDFAMIKARKAFAESAEQVAYGWAALSNPITRPLAGGHFLAAAKFAGVGALWSALGGGVNAGASAIRSGSPGLGQMNAKRTRYDSSTRADDSRRTGSDIHIFIDGVDPRSARHQELLGKTIQEYNDRHGGNITVNGR